MLLLPPLLLLLPFITLINASVFKALLLLLLLLLLLESVFLLPPNAPTSAKVAKVLLEDPPLPPLPPSPPLTASSVVAGLLPRELITTASVVDMPLLLSMATAANGLILPLVTPDNKIIFFQRVLLLIVPIPIVIRRALAALRSKLLLRCKILRLLGVRGWSKLS